MKSFLFTNAFFEEELSSSSYFPIGHLLQQHPLYFQLQYLSCVLAQPSEIPLLSHPPSKDYLIHLQTLGLSPFSFALLDQDLTTPSYLSSWGFSHALSKWALAKNCNYITPSRNTIYNVQSKEFSFRHFPQPKYSQKISDKENLISWWHSFSGPRVLKTLYGSSGRGHFLSNGDSSDLSKALSFLTKHKESSPVLIAQPWLTRILDFSSQWHIAQNGTISYLGSTLCENSSRGTYQKSITGKESLLFASYFSYFEEHLAYARKALERLKDLSFFGNVGFDAFIYKDPQTTKEMLFPIVEINARRTMGWAAVQLFNKLSLPSHVLLTIHYQSKTKDSKKSLLPFSHEGISFPKQLSFEINLVCI